MAPVVQKEVAKNNLKIKWLIFTVTVLGNFIAMLDGSSINVALYEISQDLNLKMSMVQWIVIAYILVQTIFLPFFGRLSDTVGRKKMYMWGFLIFALGSFLNTQAPSFAFLIVSRIIQAFGASILISNSNAITASIFKGQKRGKALGITGAVIAVGGMSGPAIGGILMHFMNWRLIFVPSLIIALIGAYFSYKFIPTGKISSNKTFDIKGLIYFLISISSFLIAISQGHSWGWGSKKVIFLIGLFAVFLFLFILTEKKHLNPMINISMFKNKNFTLGNLALALAFMCMFCNVILFPFYTQQILHYSPLKTGLMILSFSIALCISAPISGNLSGKYGSRKLTSVGILMLSLGLFIFTFTNQSTKEWQLILVNFFMGIGNGMFQSPSNTAIIGSVRKADIGIASGLLSLFRNMGMLIGIALAITLFESVNTRFLNLGLQNTFAFLEAYHSVLYLGIFFGVVTSILCFFAYKDKKISPPGKSV